MVNPLPKLLENRYITLGARLLLGGTFILSGIGKLPERAAFVDVVSSYGLLPLAVARAYGLALPWLELVIGFLVVVGLFPRFSAGLSLLIVASFLVANGTRLYKGEPATGCGCFGELLDTLSTGNMLAIDGALVVLGLLVLFHRRSALSLDSWLFRWMRQG